MRAIVQANTIGFDITTKCQGVIFVQDSLNAEPITLESLEIVQVVLKSNSVRDKILYELNQDDFISLQNGLLWKNPISVMSRIYIPFAIGNLQLTEKDYLEVRVTFKQGTYANGDVLEFERVLVKQDASNPIAVKKVENKDEFDSAYYNSAIIKNAVGFDYVSDNGDKIYIPALFVGMSRNNGVTVVNLEQNKTYAMSSMEAVLLVDH